MFFLFITSMIPHSLQSSHPPPPPAFKHASSSCRKCVYSLPFPPPILLHYCHISLHHISTPPPTPLSHSVPFQARKLEQIESDRRITEVIPYPTPNITTENLLTLHSGSKPQCRLRPIAAGFSRHFLNPSLSFHSPPPPPFTAA